MDIILEDSSVSGIQKFVKLAVVENPRNALLGPFPEPEDSGIDSDDPSLTRAALTLQLSENSSSDDEYSDQPCPYHDLNPAGVPLVNMSDAQRDALGVLIQWQPPGEEYADRGSPPLYEVELTASDEDDDASVLELVIPMQSRYQRVPTSSPKKAKPKPSMWLRLFCCLRK